MWKAEFYETVDGEMPVKDFLDSLDIKMRAKAVRQISLLNELGTKSENPIRSRSRTGFSN